MNKLRCYPLGGQSQTDKSNRKWLTTSAHGKNSISCLPHYFKKTKTTRRGQTYQFDYYGHKIRGDGHTFLIITNI